MLTLCYVMVVSCNDGMPSVLLEWTIVLRSLVDNTVFSQAGRLFPSLPSVLVIVSIDIFFPIHVTITPS